MTPLPVDDAGRPDLTRLIRAGDRIVIGQGAAEPTILTAALVAQQNAIGPLDLFLGMVFSNSFAPPTGSDGLSFSSYGALGNSTSLARSGRLEVIPAHYSTLPAMFASGQMPVDVVLLMLAPGHNGEPPSLALANDYVLDAARKARLVIAEINPNLPAPCGGEWPSDLRIDHYIDSTAPILEMPPRSADSPAAQRIAAHVAALVPDGAVLQIGIGGLPDAILAGLHGHRDLGVHSGIVGDRVVDLIDCGAVTNARKPFDTGITVAGNLVGTRRLYRYADRNPQFRLSGPSHTHALAVLARLPRFTAINSAIEVDLTGQINAEVADGVYLGAVGGQGDFMRGAQLAAAGRAIIALPATAKGGRNSRIVARLNGPVTSARSDADTIVTEFGMAELRGCSLRERARRLIAIADPSFRDDLERAARAIPL